MNSDRHMPLAAPDHGAFEAELKIHGGLAEGDLLYMHPGVVGVGVSLEAANEEIVTEGASDSRQPGDTKRFHAIDPKRINVLRVGLLQLRKPPALAGIS